MVFDSPLVAKRWFIPVTTADNSDKYNLLAVMQLLLHMQGSSYDKTVMIILS